MKRDCKCECHNPMSRWDKCSMCEHHHISPLDQEKQRIVKIVESVYEHGKCTPGQVHEGEMTPEDAIEELQEMFDALHAAVVREVEKMLDNAKKYPMRNHKGEEIYEWNQGYASALRQIITLLSAPNKDKEE